MRAQRAYASPRITESRNSLVAGRRHEFWVFAISQGRAGLSSNAAVTGNSAPTGSFAVAAPDPTTGVVTVPLTGTDIDRDPLTFWVVTWPAKGSITRNVATTADASQMSFPYTPADLADTFSDMIRGGYGGSVTVPTG